MIVGRGGTPQIPPVGTLKGFRTKPGTSDDIVKETVEAGVKGMGDDLDTLEITVEYESNPIRQATEGAYEAGLTKDEALEYTPIGEGVRDAGLGEQIVDPPNVPPTGYKFKAGPPSRPPVRWVPQPERVTKMDPKEGYFTQKTTRSMKGPENQIREMGGMEPVVVVRMPDGKLAYLDHARPEHAIRMAREGKGFEEIDVAIYNSDEPIPIERAWGMEPPEGFPEQRRPATWGEAIDWRLQNNGLEEPRRRLPVVIDERKRLKRGEQLPYAPLNDNNRDY